MLQIKDLLGSFKNIEDPSQYKRVAASVMNSILKADVVTEADIDYRAKDCILVLRVNPAIRHKILISKERCLGLLSSALPNMKIVDIR